MVHARLAERLLPHCPKGVALDILTAATNDVPLLNASPSAAIVWDRIRHGKLSLDSTVSLTAATDSADVLAKIVKKDKRLKVRRAAAENPYLGEEEMLFLLQDAIERSDVKTLEALWDGGDIDRKVHLLNSYSYYRMLTGKWAEELFALVTPRGDAALERVCETLNEQDLKRFLQARVDKSQTPLGEVSATGFLAAIQKYYPALLTDDGYRKASFLARLLIRAEDGREVWREIFKVLPGAEVIGQMAEHSSEGLISQDELFALAASETKSCDAIIKVLQYNRVPLGREAVEYLLQTRRAQAAFYNERLTSEGQKALVHHNQWKSLAQTYNNLSTDAQVQLLNTYPTLVSYVSFSHREAWDFYQNGLKVDLFWEILSTTTTSSRISFNDKEFKKFVITNGPTQAVTNIWPGDDDIALIAEREDGEKILQTIFRNTMHHNVTYSDDNRRLGYLYLNSTAYQQALVGHNAMKEGDIPYFLEKCNEEQKNSFVQNAQILLARGYNTEWDWAKDAVRYLPLDWRTINQPHTVGVLLEIFSDAFGENKDKWQMGLTLLTEWNGTITGLLETVEII